MRAIYKKELWQYINSMVGFAFLAFFLAIVGFYTWGYNLSSGLANYEITLGSISFLFVMLIPILSMRILAEENHQKTDQLLYTAPISVTRIVLAKYLAILSLFFVGILVIGIYPVIISSYGEDVPLASSYSSLIGFFLLGAACIAIGVFVSALTESQAIAAVVSFVILLVSFLMEGISAMLPTDVFSQCVIFAVAWLGLSAAFYRLLKNIRLCAVIAVAGEVVIWGLYFVKSSLYDGLLENVLNMLSLPSRFNDFEMGILNYDAIVYYVTIIALFLFLTIQLIRSQQYKAGIYSSVLVVFTIAIVVAVNLVFGRLGLSTDLSTGSYFTLSEDTERVVSQMEKDVDIYYMVQDNREIDYIDRVLRQYGKLSKHLTLKKIDPVVNPSFASKLGVSDKVSDNDVIVYNETEETAKYISSSELLPVDYNYSTGAQISYLDVEGQVTSAIQNVLSDVKTKIYVLTKHNEMDLGTDMEESLEKLGMEMEDLELATQEAVPEDCDILLVNGPAVDITEVEKNYILDYLKKGGRAMINLRYTDQEMDNMEAVLDAYGVKVTRGLMCEAAGKYYIYPNYIVPEQGYNQEVLEQMEGYLVFPDAVGLTAADTKDSVTISELLSSSDEAYVKVDPSSGDAAKADGDVDGPFAIGLYVQGTVEADSTGNGRGDTADSSQGDASNDGSEMADGSDGGASDGSQGDASGGSDGDVADGSDEGASDGSQGDASGGSDGDVADGSDGDASDGSDKETADGSDGDVADGSEEDASDSNGEQKQETKLMVYASAGGMTESFTSSELKLANGELLKQSVSALTDTKLEKVSIDKKNLDYSYVSIPMGGQLFWAAVIIIILPLGLLITGFVIWLLRRRK